MDQNKMRRADDKRPALPLRWGERFTLLLTGQNSGIVGQYGATWSGQPAHYERVNVIVEGAVPKLDDIELYRIQMAGISAASMGHWKLGEEIHPDYDTTPLRDVARLYAKYDELFKFRESVRGMIQLLKNREWAEDLAATGDAAELQGVITELVGAGRPAGAADTTASASIDTPEFREMLALAAKGNGEAWRKFIAYIDSRATQPVQAGEAVDERALFEGIERAANLRRVGVEQDGSGGWYENPCTQSAWEGFQAGRATLAPVAAQQAAAVVAPSDEQIIAALRANGIDTYPSKYGFDAVQVSATSVPSLRNVFAALYATAGAATTSEDARDAEMLRWLSAHPTWGTRWRIKNGKEQWQMWHDGESWGQWGEYRKVLEAAMRATQQEGGK